MSRRKGMALTYTIGFIVVLVLFMGSIYARTLHTIRFTQYDANLIQAKQLSEAGLLFAVLTIRDIDPFFYEDPPFSAQGDSWVLDGEEHQDFFAGTPFAESEIDGHFQLKIYDTSQYVTPETGTFLTIESRGKVRNRIATSKMTVKLTNPYLNYLIVARDELQIGFETLAPREVRGPILVVDDNPGDGKGGDVVFSHMTQFGTSSSYRIQKGGVIMNGDITTTGQLRIDNKDEADRPRSGSYSGFSYDGGGLSLLGFDDLDGDGVTEPISSTFHIRDFENATGSGPPELTTYGGEIEFQDVEVLDDVPVRPGMHTMDVVLDSIARLKNEPHVHNVDIGSSPEGVLVEFSGGRVFVSEATTQDSGYFFTDADFWVDPDYRYLMEYRLGVSRSIPVGGSQEQIDVRNEVVWDDPAFRNADPTGWPNTSSFPAGVVVDAFDITHVARGSQLSAFPLRDDEWTIIRLLTSSINVEGAKHTATVAPDGTVGTPTLDPGRHAPPVYVRGIVDGKVVLVYDVADGTDKSERANLHVGILGQHELDTDPPLGAGGRLPGGLLYADRRVKLSEDDIGRDGFTDDMAVIVCGGSVGPMGDSGYAFRRVRRKSDNTVQNLRQIYEQRDQQMIATYSTGGEDDDNFKIVSYMYHQLKDHVKVPFYGVGIAGQSGRHNPRYDVENGRLFPPINKSSSNMQDNFPAAYFEAENEFSDRPTGHASTDENPLGTFMRWTRGVEGGAMRLFGSFHGLSGNPGLKGEQNFDYRLQELKAKDIYEGMGLPVTTILADWERP